MFCFPSVDPRGESREQEAWASFLSQLPLVSQPWISRENRNLQADNRSLYYSFAFNFGAVMKNNIKSVLEIWCFQVLSPEAAKTDTSVIKMISDSNYLNEEKQWGFCTLFAV